MNRLRHGRLSRWPKIYQGRDNLILSAKVMTPARLSIIKHCLLLPLVILWSWAFRFLLLEAFLSWMKLWNLFLFIPAERIQVYVVMIVLAAFWRGEQASAYTLCRWLFGRRLRIKISDHHVSVGGWLLRKRFSREHDLTFALSGFEQAREDIYQHSRSLDLIVDQSTRVRVCELFGIAASEHIVGNANNALQLGVGPSRDDLDLDPTRLAQS